MFYDIDSTKVSCREYLWWHKSPLVIFPLLNKWTGTRSLCSSDDPPTDSLFPFAVDTLPPEVSTRFASLTAAFLDLGFCDPIYHVIDDPASQVTVYWATFRHESGNYFARIHQRIWHRAQKADRGLFPIFFTAFTDGTFLVSSSGKPDMATPPSIHMNRMFAAPLASLWLKHQQLVTVATAKKLIAPIHNRADLANISEQYHILVRDFNLNRGVFRPRTEDQLAAAQTFHTHVQEAQAQGLDHANIIAELRALQLRKPAWKNFIWLFIFSFAAFVLAGAARWNWTYLVLIIPILLFHETGHWVAMRMFHYRNLRMFFIPFFGAAVTGRNWNVPGWKKAIVSLAGPLPGITLGCILGMVGLVIRYNWLTELSFLLVFINGFNLLPVLPLDGGRLVYYLLFCRNRWLDISYRVLAIIGLFLMTELSRFFLYLAVLIAIGLPNAFKLAKITDKLRRESLPEPQPGEDLIPLPTAQAIITEVKAAFSSQLGNAVIARRALNIFETLNARPPGAWATIGLLMTYAGAVIISVVFSILLLINRQTPLDSFIRATLDHPHHAYKYGSVETWQGNDTSNHLLASHTQIIATFPRRTEAVAEFASLTNQLPSVSRLTLFGDSLILTLPATNSAACMSWSAQIQNLTTNLVIAYSNQPVQMNVMFIAPNHQTVSNLLSDLQFYIYLPPETHIIPPWSLAQAGPNFEAYQQARQYWNYISDQFNRATTTTPDRKQTDENLASALKRHDTNAAQQIMDQQMRLIRQIQDGIHQRLLAAATNSAQTNIINYCWSNNGSITTNQFEIEESIHKFIQAVGEIPANDDMNNPDLNQSGANGGSISANDLVILLNNTTVQNPDVFLPVVTRWLASHRCIDFRYDFVAPDSDSD